MNDNNTATHVLDSGDETQALNFSGGEPVRTTVDLWDLGRNDYLQPSETLPMPDMTNASVVHEAVADNDSRNKRLLALALIAIVGTLVVFYVLDSQQNDPWDQVQLGETYKTKEPSLVDKALSFIGLKEKPLEIPSDVSQMGGAFEKNPSMGRVTTPEGALAPGSKNEVTVEVTEVLTEPQSEKRVVDVVEGNPYWILPNQIRGREPNIKRGWRADEEDAFRRMLGSPYTYQRYKMVEEIRKRKLKGSESLLFNALKDKKLWTRMSALIGIAEFGYSVDLATVDEALTSARKHRLANYFKRFRANPTGPESFILRHALKLVGETSRLYILQSLAKRPNDLNRLYLVAAAYDPGPRIQKWLRAHFPKLKTNAEELGQFDRIIRGLDRAPLEMLKDDYLASQMTNYEKARAKEIQLFGVGKEVDSKGDADDGFSDLEVIEIKADQF